MKRVRGYYTAEAALIMGILLFCIGAAAEMILYRYNEIALEALAAELAWEYAKQEELPCGEEIRERAEKRLVQTSIEEIYAEKEPGKTVLSYRAVFTAPGWGIGRWLPGQGKMIMEGSASAGNLDTPEMLRIKHAWSRRGGQDGHSLQK